MNDQTEALFTVVCLDVAGGRGKELLPTTPVPSNYPIHVSMARDGEEILQQADVVLLLGGYTHEVAHRVRGMRRAVGDKQLPVFVLLAPNAVDEAMRELADETKVQLLPLPIPPLYLWFTLHDACHKTSLGTYRVQPNRRRQFRVPLNVAAHTLLDARIIDISADGVRFSTNHSYTESDKGALHATTVTQSAAETLDFEVVNVTPSEDKTFKYVVHARFLEPPEELASGITKAVDGMDPFF